MKRNNNDIVVKFCDKIYTYKKGSPEWQDWQMIPSYDDPEMIFDLMIGSYVDEFKALIPELITNVIEDETTPGSDWSMLLDEAYKIYFKVRDFFDTRVNKNDWIPELDAIFEQYYDIAHKVVCIHYKKSYGQSSKEEYEQEVMICKQDYDNLIRILLQYKERIKLIETCTYNCSYTEGIDRLIDIFNHMFKRFYNQSIKYGIYFKEYDKKKNTFNMEVTLL